MPIRAKIKGSVLKAFAKKVKALGDGTAIVLSEARARKLGEDLIAEMKDMISKGISPIESVGRFPEYKGVTEIRRLKEKARKLRATARVAGKVLGKSNRARQIASAYAGRYKQAAADLKKRVYPYTVMKKYPEKGVRPVNLRLSGAMLDALEYGIYKVRFGFGVEIGYYDAEQAKKEQGHAEGVNGQPLRPTIPDRASDYAVRLQRIVLEAFREAVSEYVKGK